MQQTQNILLFKFMFTCWFTLIIFIGFTFAQWLAGILFIHGCDVIQFKHYVSIAELEYVYSSTRFVSVQLYTRTCGVYSNTFYYNNFVFTSRGSRWYSIHLSPLRITLQIHSSAILFTVIVYAFNLNHYFM